MKRTAVMLGLTLAVGIALGTIGTQVLNAQYAQQQEPIKRTVLQKVDLGDKEAVMFLAEDCPRGCGGQAFSPRARAVLHASGVLGFGAGRKATANPEGGGF